MLRIDSATQPLQIHSLSLNKADAHSVRRSCARPWRPGRPVYRHRQKPRTSERPLPGARPRRKLASGPPSTRQEVVLEWPHAASAGGSCVRAENMPFAPPHNKAKVPTVSIFKTGVGLGEGKVECSNLAHPSQVSTGLLGWPWVGRRSSPNLSPHPKPHWDAQGYGGGPEGHFQPLAKVSVLSWVGRS